MDPVLTWVDLDERHRDRVLRRVGDRPSPEARTGGRATVQVLPPDTRALASSLLWAPDGFRLAQAVLCVHRADPETLRQLRGAIARQAAEVGGEPARLLVFADPGSRAPDPGVHPVAAPNGGAFHPKLWIARFVGARGVRLRVAVLSADLCAEAPSCLALVSETAPSPRQASRPSRDLADLLLSLPGLATRPLPADHGVTLSTLADDVSRARFPGPPGLGGVVRFHVPGLDRIQRSWIGDQRASRVLAVAPVVRQDPLDQLAGLGARARILVSTREQLDGLPPGTLERWHQVLVVEPEPDGAFVGGRMVAVERGFDVTWWLGSADLSGEGWSGRNVEVLAEVTGRKGRDGGKTGHGIARFLRSGFGSLCAPHRPLGGSGPPP